MRAGTMNFWVSLHNKPENNPVSEAWTPLSPFRVPAAIEPLQPTDDGRTLHHAVTIRFHTQVGVDTRMTYLDPQGRTRYFFVKGIQDVTLQNVELRCLCDEVLA